MVWINSWRQVIFVNFLFFKINKVWLPTDVFSSWNESVPNCHFERLFEHAWFFGLHIDRKRTYRLIIDFTIRVILFCFLNFHWFIVLLLFETFWCIKCLRVAIRLNSWHLESFEQVSFDIRIIWTSRHEVIYYWLWFHVVEK